MIKFFAKYFKTEQIIVDYFFALIQKSNKKDQVPPDAPPAGRATHPLAENGPISF
jgi:hypothetical protein